MVVHKIWTYNWDVISYREKFVSNLNVNNIQAWNNK